MKLIRKIILPTMALSVVSPSVAMAHLVTSGLGPFYDGALHLVISPDDLLGLLAVTLLAGLCGARAGRLTVIFLPFSWFAAGLAGLNLPVTIEPALVKHSLLSGSGRPGCNRPKTASEDSRDPGRIVWRYPRFFKWLSLGGNWGRTLGIKRYCCDGVGHLSTCFGICCFLACHLDKNRGAGGRQLGGSGGNADVRLDVAGNRVSESRDAKRPGGRGKLSWWNKTRFKVLGSKVQRL